MNNEKEKGFLLTPKEENKRDWVREQDAHLQNLVSTYGTKDWIAISQNIKMAFPHQPKTAQQCCDRWQELLENESEKKSWTEQDELNMIVAHKKFKNKWADISEALRGRSNNTIKNKFYSVFRKIRGKILKSDCSYTSKLELLEIHYIVSLIEQYLAHPMLTPKPKGKRGKDFIYSLIHSLNQQMVANYKGKVQELTKGEGTMEELFSALSGECKAPTERVEILNSQLKNGIIGRPRILGVPCRKEEEVREIKQFCDPVRIEDDKFLSGPSIQKESVMESSPLFGYMPLSPPFMFSPNTLSAGPAAAAAGAARAACFGYTANDFSELSYMAKSYREKPRNDHTYMAPRAVLNYPRGYHQRTHNIPPTHTNGSTKPHYYFTQSHNN